MSMIIKRVKASAIESIAMEIVEAVLRKDANKMTLRLKTSSAFVVEVEDLKGNVVAYVGTDSD